MKKDNKAEAQIYIGPNIPRGILSRGTIFLGGIPAHVEEAAKKLPEIKWLLVPVKDLAAKEKERNTKGTPLYQFNQKILEGMKNGL